MAFDNAKRILTNEDARVASSAEGIYDDDLVILFWENVEAHHIDECVRYLNSTGQRVVSSGTTFYDVTFDDALHHLHAYYQETDQRIYRVLMRSSITTSSITQSDTKWRLQSGETYEAGTSNLVLAMYNVDPNSIVSLETESLNETYTSIYLLGGTELTGTWFNVARESEYNSQTGLYDLRWYISRYQTKEYIFATKSDQVKNIVDFFKHHMTASSIDDFEGNYYFDSATLGDYYYSTDGTNYTKKNDAAATGTLPATAKNITTEVSGRSVSYEQRPDRENGEVDIFLKLIFNQELSSTANSDFQEYTETVVRTRNASSVDAVGTPADGTQVTIEANVNDDGTFDVLKRTRVFNQQSATSGSTNAFQSESVVITNNASAEADAPSDQSDGTIVRSESEQLPNGKFRNIVRTTVARTDVGTVTDESTTGNDGGAGFTETTVKKYNQASAETVGADEDAAGTTVIVENTINEDGTFNTIKRTRVEREAQAASGTKGVLSSEAVVITNNAASALAQAGSTTAGTTKIHESQQLENGLFRNIQRTITSHANDGSTDKIDQTGSSETILRKYNQATALAHDASEEANGTTITVENTINSDGTFNTVKRTRVDSELSATGGSANAFRNEVVAITINANAQLGQPSDPSDGVSTIHESEQLPNGLFRNTVRTITARTDVATVADERSSGVDDGAGFTEVITKKYNQSSAESVGENDDGAGKTVTVENTINEDGTFNTVKSIRTDRESTASSGTRGTLTSETVTITNNASEALAQDSTATVGQTKINTSEQLENGLFRNVERVITSHANDGSTDVTDQTGSSEEIIKKYNQSQPLSHDQSEEADGKTITVENTINPDGTYNTIKRTKTDAQLTATGGSDSGLKSETVVITNNASSALGAPGNQADGTILIHESEQLSNGLYRNIARTITAKGITDINDGTVSGNGTNAGYTETILKEYNQTAEATLSGDDTGVGKTSTVENTLNEDGTFNTIKRIRTDRESTATGGSTNALRSESVVITNNAANPLNAPTDQTDGTILIHESEQLPNGLYRNVARTITARTDFATITDEMSSGSDGNFHAYTETIVKKYNQTSPLSYDDNDDAVGRIRKQESTPNEDGTFNTIETTRTYQGFSRFYNTKDKHYLVGYHLNPNSETDFKYTGQGSGTTFANLRSYAAGFKGTFDIVDNDDGTVSYKAVLSKSVDDHTLTVRKGGKVTETIEYLRNTTDGAIDTKLSNLSSSPTAGTVVNVQRITGENGALDAILSKTVTDSSSLSRSYDNGATDIDYEFGFGATSVPANDNSLADGTSCVLQASQREDGLFDYVKTTTTVTNYSRQFSLRNQIILLGHHVSTTEDTTGFKTPDHPGGTTFNNFKTYISSKDAQLELRENDDNTVSYIVRINSGAVEEYVTPLAGDNEISTRIIVKENQASFPDQKDIAESVEIDINGDFTNTSGTANRADTWVDPAVDTSTAGIYFTDAGTVRLRDQRTAGVNNTVDAYLKKNDSYLDAGKEYRFTYTVTEFNDASGETSNLKFQYNESGLDNNVDDGVTGVTGFGSDYNSVDMNKEVGTHSFTFTAGGTGGVTFNIYHTNGSDTKNSYIVLKDLILEQLSHLNETDGSTFTTRSLTGPSGSGTPVINPDGTYSYAIVSETRTVSKIAGVKGSTDGTDFYLRSMGKRTERNSALKNTSFQQIQRRIGGELEYEKDDQGNLVGVNWSADWDLGTNANGGTYPSTTAPDNWTSDGYEERYGEWKGHYVKTYMVGEGSLISPTIPTATCRGLYRADAVYQLGDVVYSTDTSSDGPGGSADWYVVTGATQFTFSSQGSYSEGVAIQAGNVIYTVTASEVPDSSGTAVDNKNFSPSSNLGKAGYEPGASGKAIRDASGWSTIDDDFVKQKIGIDGSGYSLFKDIDFHIPIQKETSREVEWNTAWEYDASTAYTAGQYVFHVATQQTYKRVTSGTGTTPGTNSSIWLSEVGNPTGWDSGGYKDKHGDWQGRFTKSFKTGQGSLDLALSFENAGENRGEHSSTAIYQIGDVVLTQSTAADKRHNPLFKVLTADNVSLFNEATNYSSGSVVKSGNKVYTAIAQFDSNNQSFGQSPGTSDGANYWSAGALGSALTATSGDDWDSVNEESVIAVIGNKNAGTAPFEQSAKVGVLDGSGGFAVAANTRLAYYTNPNENPRICEIYEATKREEIQLLFRTYFAVNPDYLDANKRRIAQDFSAESNIESLITDLVSTSGASGNNKVLIPSKFGILNGGENYDVSFMNGREGNFFYTDITINLRSPFVADVEALETIRQRGSNSYSKIVNDKVIIYRDLTHTTKPWEGDFLER